MWIWSWVIHLPTRCHMLYDITYKISFAYILKFGCGCGMNFRENAISLVADNLRGSEDQVEYFQKNRIFPNSFNCSACDICCARVNWKSGTNFFYFWCPNCHLERRIFYRRCFLNVVKSFDVSQTKFRKAVSYTHLTLPTTPYV